MFKPEFPIFQFSLILINHSLYLFLGKKKRRGSTAKFESPPVMIAIFVL